MQPLKYYNLKRCVYKYDVWVVRLVLHNGTWAWFIYWRFKPLHTPTCNKVLDTNLLYTMSISAYVISIWNKVSQKFKYFMAQTPCGKNLGSRDGFSRPKLLVLTTYINLTFIKLLKNVFLPVWNHFCDSRVDYVINTSIA